MAESQGSERRQATRRYLEPDEATLAFVVEQDAMYVQNVDVSETGIGFETERPLGVMLRLKWGDREEARTARLVWIGHTANGGMRYGFEFVDE